MSGAGSPGASSTTFAGQASVGRSVSSTMIICTAVLRLPHSSIAVQVLAITLALPHELLTTSLYVTVVWLHPSTAVARPAFHVLVSAPHWNTISGGAISAGLRMSAMVMVCTAVLRLPRPSMAVHVRAITLFPTQFSFTTSLKLIVTSPMASSAVAMPVLRVLVSAGHSSRISAGIVKAGAVYRAP